MNKFPTLRQHNREQHALPPLLLCFALYVCAVPAARALSFDLPEDGDLVGEVQEVVTRYEDTLPDLAARFGIGYREIVAANPDINPWFPGEGKTIIIPQQFILPPGKREGVVINLSELRLYYYPRGQNKVLTYAIGIGREGWDTPTGDFSIVSSIKSPSWIPPQSIRKEYKEDGIDLPRVVPPGPDNPLGDYKLELNLPGYLIHGTNKPLGVGMRVSHGCIRMYPDDIEEFVQLRPKGEPVRIVKLPYKAGWLQGRLFLEAHKPLHEEFDQSGLDLTSMVAAVIAAHKENDAVIDWEHAEAQAEQHNGSPVPITAALAESETEHDVPAAANVALQESQRERRDEALPPQE